MIMQGNKTVPFSFLVFFSEVIGWEDSGIPTDQNEKELTFNFLQHFEVWLLTGKCILIYNEDK